MEVKVRLQHCAFGGARSSTVVKAASRAAPTRPQISSPPQLDAGLRPLVRAFLARSKALI